jgi:hypothetical protein
LNKNLVAAYFIYAAVEDQLGHLGHTNKSAALAFLFTASLHCMQSAHSRVLQENS